jgi:hypothetical protein
MLVICLCAAVFVPASAARSEVPATARVVREEALRPNRSPAGRPLPLLGHWHRMTTPPSWQVEMIRKGHPFLPWISYHRGMRPERIAEQYGDALATLREWNLPIVLLTGGQWEADFYRKEEYLEAPADKTGATVGLDGKKLKSVSPFSPVQPWRELGVKWTDNPACRKFQELYPDPPLVFFLTNNEAHDLGWSEVEKSKRYMDTYGPGRSDDFKRKVVRGGWAARYGALVEGMKVGLPADGWRQNCRIIAYNGFRQPWWDGAVPSAYDNHWQPTKKAFHAYSCQAEMMNLHFMKPRRLEDDPDFWLEVIFWDGDGGKAIRYEDLGVAYTPELYGGWNQYALWTVTPRVAREWRGSAYRRDAGWWPYFATIIRAVGLVHADPVLKRFWRRGDLVANPGAENPVTHGIPKPLQSRDRWYHLPTNLDPPRPWEAETRIPVYTLARVLGEAPNREWLLYAHAPVGEDRRNVEVTIPGYRTVTVDVRVGGSFYHLKEADGSVVPVGDLGQVISASNAAPTAHDDDYAIAGRETLTTTVMRFSGIPGVLRNDRDDEGDPLTAELVQGPRHGRLTFRENGTFAYTPEKGYDGVDSFTYCTRDLKQTSEPADVEIRVTDGLARVIDDGDAGYGETARWLTKDGAGGMGGSIAYFPAGRLGGSTATWTFADLPAGQYDVFATWPLFSYSRPSRVPLDILDGATSRAKVYVNQDAEPEGETVDGRPWQRLANVKVASGTLKVVLGTAARGRWVVADAVRIVPAGGGEARVIDNEDAGFTRQPGWLLHDQGFEGDARYLRGTKKREAEATARWAFDGLEPGVYELFATWPAGVSRMPVNYSVFCGNTPKGTVRIDQGRRPDDLLARDTLWASLGAFVVEARSIRVVLSNVGAKENVMADAMALLRGERRVGVLLDDADERFTSTVKTKTIDRAFRGRAQRFPAKRIDPKIPPARWKVRDLPAGRYRVMATWFANGNHCRQSVYRVTSGGTVLVTATVDQSAKPQGPRFEGAVWQKVGILQSGGGPVAIHLTAPTNAEGHVVADGIWLRPVEE